MDSTRAAKLASELGLSEDELLEPALVQALGRHLRIADYTARARRVMAAVSAWRAERR